MSEDTDHLVREGPTPPLDFILERGLPDYPPAKAPFATHGRKAKRELVTLSASEL